MLHFNARTRQLDGNGRIEASWLEVEQYLLGSPRRQDLYERLQAYNRKLFALVGQPFMQWLDGSFVSLKSLPKDIDIVSFPPFEAVEAKLGALARFKNSEANPGDFPGLDCAIIPLWEAERSGNQTNTDKSWWEDHFRKTRPDKRSGIQLSKGFLELRVEGL